MEFSEHRATADAGFEEFRPLPLHAPHVLHGVKDRNANQAVGTSELCRVNGADMDCAARHLPSITYPSSSPSLLDLKRFLRHFQFSIRIQGHFVCRESVHRNTVTLSLLGPSDQFHYDRQQGRNGVGLPDGHL